MEERFEVRGSCASARRVKIPDNLGPDLKVDASVSGNAGREGARIAAMARMASGTLCLGHNTLMSQVKHCGRNLSTSHVAVRRTAD